MAKVILCIGSLGRDVTDPLTSADEQVIVDTFADASGGAIEFEIERPALEPTGVTGSVTAYDLHTLSNRLTRNSQAPGRVRRVALIFASQYAPRHDLYGVMFDRGFATTEEPSSSVLERSVPREGCAVFVGEVERVKANALEISRQVLFTAIHELGHVFNLLHRDGAQFMAGSFGGPSAPKPKLWKFIHDQKTWLAGADSDPMVWPGGAHFLDRSEERASDRPRMPPGQRLAISMASRQFTYRSPVELDISLSLDGAREGRVSVPSEIDAGYPGFQVWIEDPDGERRRYRPINRYCAPASSFDLTQEKPFERDLSIYGQSGGFTFHMPGPHRVWARLATGDGDWLVSNAVEFEVLAPRFQVRTDSEFLKSRKVQALLFYRKLRQARDAMAIEHDAAEVKDRTLRANVNYALARSLERHVAGRPKAGAAREIMLRQARLATERPQWLGRRQAYHLARILDGRDAWRP